MNHSNESRKVNKKLNTALLDSCVIRDAYFGWFDAYIDHLAFTLSESSRMIVKSEPCFYLLSHFSFDFKEAVLDLV